MRATIATTQALAGVGTRARGRAEAMAVKVAGTTAVEMGEIMGGTGGTMGEAAKGVITAVVRVVVMAAGALEAALAFLRLVE